MPEFKAIERPHEQIHTLIKQVISLREQGDEAAAEAAFDEVSALSGQIVQLIDTLAGAQTQATAEIADFADRSIQQVSASTRSDTADVLNNLTKWVTGALAVGIVVFAVTR